MTCFLVEDLETDEPLAIEGYAAIYAARSVPMRERGGRREVIAPGAFSRTLVGHAVPTYAHLEDQDWLHGAQLDAWADEWGLAFRVTNIPASEWSAGLVRSIGEGAITGCSFSFLSEEGQYIEDEETGEELYCFTRIMNLTDVGICVRPAFPLATCWLAHSRRLSDRQRTLQGMFDSARRDPPARPLAEPISARLREIPEGADIRAAAVDPQARRRDRAARGLQDAWAATYRFRERAGYR